MGLCRFLQVNHLLIHIPLTIKTRDKIYVINPLTCRNLLLLFPKQLWWVTMVLNSKELTMQAKHYLNLATFSDLKLENTRIGA